MSIYLMWTIVLVLVGYWGAHLMGWAFAREMIKDELTGRPQEEVDKAMKCIFGLFVKKMTFGVLELPDPYGGEADTHGDLSG